MELNLPLHAGQRDVFSDTSRFKLVAAGRRWGKTHMSAVYTLTKALLNEKKVDGRARNLKDLEVWYVAPTYDMAKDIFWGLFKNLAQPLIAKVWENDGKIQLKNGRCVQIKGSDRPDRLRGVGLSAIVMDEFASMKPETWDTILRPTLADVEGEALFIGTPLRKNHFYELYLQALRSEDWGCYHFESQTNPYLPKAEVSYAKSTMPAEVFKQEFQASFETGGGLVFDYPLIKVSENEVPRDGQVYAAMDPAGFYTESQTRGRINRLDETAIAIVKVSREGWYVLDVLHGRWDVRETSIRFLRACQKYKPIATGIEKGMQRQAVLPYLTDQMKRLGIWVNPLELTHGGQAKASRIAWALQGRMEHGRLHFVEGDYLAAMEEQIYDFPNGRHDDMLDALAYIDQIASTFYHDDWMTDNWEPLDAAVGL